MSDSMVEQPEGKFALVNGQVILPYEVMVGKAVVIEGNRILDVVDAGSLSREVRKIDVGGRYITPGLIDIHTHGGMGYTFNDPTAEAFETITRMNASHGVTALLATLAAAAIPDLLQCLEFSRRWMQESHSGAQVLGVHLEGPYFSLAQKGAQDPANIRTPDDGTADLLLAHHDVIRIMTYAPELPGALELTAR
jgi:N-acetylglucosamine-6-phosphate deacetylase